MVDNRPAVAGIGRIPVVVERRSPVERGIGSPDSFGSWGLVGMESPGEGRRSLGLVGRGIGRAVGRRRRSLERTCLCGGCERRLRKLVLKGFFREGFVNYGWRVARSFLCVN